MEFSTFISQGIKTIYNKEKRGCDELLTMVGGTSKRLNLEFLKSQGKIFPYYRYFTLEEFVVSLCGLLKTLK